MVKRTLKALGHDLKSLADKVAEMGIIAERMLATAIDAVVHNDRDLAHSTIASDKQLDVLQRQIQEEAVLVIARRQPVAVDLRQIMGAIRISGDLERVGDLAHNIAKRVAALPDAQWMPIVMKDFKRKGNFALLQIRDALDAYGRLDEHRAEAVWLRNIQVREELDSVTNKIISIMIENPRAITASAQLLFISKNFEHIVGLAIHIAEAVHYMVTGELFPTDQENNSEFSRDLRAL